MVGSAIENRLAALMPELRDLEPSVRTTLLDRAQVVALKQGQFVFHAGDLCEAFLLLLDGSVRVQLTSESGREVTLYRIGAGGSCILTTSCLLSRENYPAEAITESNVEAIAIPISSFERALNGSPEFRRLVFDGFSTRLTSVIRKIEQIAFTSIDTRLARALLELNEKGVRSITHQDLSVELGTAREVVSRHLKRFESRGLLKLGRGRIDLIDVEKLGVIAAQSAM